MKKNAHFPKKPALVLRREHIRLLTSAELESVAGGYPNDPDERPPTGTCKCQSLDLGAAC